MDIKTLFLLACFVAVVVLVVWGIGGIAALPSHDWDLQCAKHYAYMQAHKELGTGLQAEQSPYYQECAKYA